MRLFYGDIEDTQYTLGIFTTKKGNIRRKCPPLEGAGPREIDEQNS